MAVRDARDGLGPDLSDAGTEAPDLPGQATLSATPARRGTRSPAFWALLLLGAASLLGLTLSLLAAVLWVALRGT